MILIKKKYTSIELGQTFNCDLYKISSHLEMCHLNNVTLISQKASKVEMIKCLFFSIRKDELIFYSFINKITSTLCNLIIRQLFSV